MRYGVIRLAKFAEIRDFVISRFVNRSPAIRYRAIILELWAMFALACVVGFLGPFDTYGDGPLVDRVQQWWMLLMGAYILIRPCIAGLNQMAKHLQLPQRMLAGWGVVILSIPLAMIWRNVGQYAYRLLHGYAELVPFSLLCGGAVLAATLWARNVDWTLSKATIETSNSNGSPLPSKLDFENNDDAEPRALQSLHRRLASDFQGPIVALQSDDHYVHVHGQSGRQLILMRLREAIAEMGDEPGEQIHRSWWVARSGIAKVERDGRDWNVHLVNGEVAPVSRDAVHRLRQSGFLSEAAANRAA